MLHAVAPHKPPLSEVVTAVWLCLESLSVIHVFWGSFFLI